MHNDTPEWGSYAAACIRKIPTLTADEKAQIQNEGERCANSTDKVFTTESGGTQILWKYTNGILSPVGDHFPLKGWMEKPDGTREYVEYHVGWGWMTPDELFAARQQYPRDAP